MMTRSLILSLVLVALILPACEQSGPQVARLVPASVGGHAFITLPAKYNTPDGMTLAKDGNIYLCMPNFNDPAYPAKLLKIDANNLVSEVCTLPVHPETNRVCPLGIDQGPDGNLYIADCQAFEVPNVGEHRKGSPDKSRVLRVVLAEGKAAKVEVLACGINFANGLACNGDSVYVCDSQVDAKASPVISGVYRFKMSELKADKPVQVTPGGKDKHLITTFKTVNKDWGVGANGLGFDKAGNMFVCNFGDAQLLKYEMKNGAPVGAGKVFAEKQGMQSTDGLKVDDEGNVYIADFLGNAVHKVDAKTGKVTTLAQNPNTNGANGLLDKCSEVCIRGDWIYVANIDLNLAGNAFDKPYTLTIIPKK